MELKSSSGTNPIVFARKCGGKEKEPGTFSGKSKEVGEKINYKEGSIKKKGRQNRVGVGGRPGSSEERLIGVTVYGRVFKRKNQGGTSAWKG